jgi:hypothetical protein
MPHKKYIEVYFLEAYFLARAMFVRHSIFAFIKDTLATLGI